MDIDEDSRPDDFITKTRKQINWVTGLKVWDFG
jgi:hypothetical protein